MSIARLMQMAAAGQAGDYQISRSLRFNSADSAYLSRTPASAGNRKTWTWSGWVKRSAVGASSAALFSVNTASGTTGYTAFFFQGSVNNLYFETREAGGGKVWETTPVYRDASAWYHIVLAVDTSQATATNRVKMYVNGTQITAFSTQNTITLDFLTSVNDTVSHDIGVVRDSGGTRVGYFNGYMTDINFIDGQALTPSSFGEVDETTGVWKPIRYAGSYGTNGFHLDFSDNSSTTALGYDAAGSNDWTPNNFSVTAGAGNDSLVDTPTPYGDDTGAGGEVRGNYCTLNPLNNPASGALTNGNLDVVTDSATAGRVVGTFGMSSGKWYWEITGTSIVTYDAVIGIAASSTFSSGTVGNETSYGYLWTGDKRTNTTNVVYGASYTDNDVIGVALDLDAGTLTFYKNGVSQGTAFSSISGTFVPALSDASVSGGSTFVCNFGQRPFAYPLSGFKALVTTNLPEPTVVQGDDYFNTVLFQSSGTGSANVTGVGFQPDFTWTKARNATNIPQLLTNVLTGKDAYLKSNSTDGELTFTDIWVTNSDGFTSANGLYNNSEPVVAWNWKANGAGVSNTDGTIGTSTVSANTTAGISIVTYTGTGSAATVGHGLGAVPRMIIVKNRDQADAWQVYHAANTANPETDYLVLNTTAATADAADRWNDTLPTSTVFSIGNGVEVNTNTEDYVAYCFAEVEGFSKFGSLTGSGSADGPFVFLNFRPAFVMLKRTDSTSNWTILDFKREGYNVDNDPLFPNLANAEGTTDLADLLSNGFKLRSTDASVNASGGTYVYAAFSSNPFKYSLGR